MATENIGQIVTREAGTDVTNKRFVDEIAGGKVNRASTQGQKVNGIVAMVSTGFTGTTIATGHPAPVAKSGDIIVESGAAVADDTEVMTDAAGRAIPFVAAANTYAVGKVVNGTSASAAGEDLTITLYPPETQHL